MKTKLYLTSLVPMRKLAYCLIFCLSGLHLHLLGVEGSMGEGLFPNQSGAREVIMLDAGQGDDLFTSEALIGLVARAVNEGRLDELLVRKPGTAQDAHWIDLTVKRLGAEVTEELTLSGAVERYKDLIKGYVVFDPDQSSGGFWAAPRVGVNRSVNYATSIASVLQALPVARHKAAIYDGAGLELLADTRYSIFGDLISGYGSELNRKYILGQDPKIANMRDVAVAHRLPVYYGNEEAGHAYSNVDAPFIALGWSVEDEFSHIQPLTRYGGRQTVSNWARHLSFLSADSHEYKPRPMSDFDLRSVGWNDPRRSVAFMLSDGDNTGWVLDGFMSPPYYGHELRGEFPVGFSTAMAMMAEMAPVVIDEFSEKTQGNVSLIEFSGGYFYPDHFGESTDNREALLRKHARLLNERMLMTNTRIMCMLVRDSSSPAAIEAYQIFAEEVSHLDGMMVMDYAPYHGGEGGLHWVENSKGIEIPVIAARYTMWKGMALPNSGNPQQVAQFIDEDNETQDAWVAVHAWSRFGDDGYFGLDAVKSTIDKLESDVRVVSPEEMIWLIRYRHNPEQTKRIVRERLAGNAR